MRYRTYRIIDGKRKIVIVEQSEDGTKIINRNPSKEELKDLREEPYSRNAVPRARYYNDGNRCEFVEEYGKRCDEKLYAKNARQFKINEKTVWFCKKHGDRYYQRHDSNSTNNVVKKSLANCRTDNKDPNHNNTKGDKYQELACIEFGWEDLNKKNDNYRSPIDCYDSKTGLFHQVRGRHYNRIDGYWYFGPLENDWNKEYESAVFYCTSEDEEMIERIYIIPFKKEIKNRRKSVGICKNPMNTRGTSPIIPWYGQYRIKDPEELRKANDIWKR